MRRFTAAHHAVAAVMAAGLVVGATFAAGTPPALASNDPLLPQQWALAKIQSEASWARSTGEGVIVAVIDTGVNFAHEDLEGASAGSFTCLRECVEGGEDVHGHGTWVAGIIAARANNGKGIAGVAPRARIMSIRTLDKTGTGDVADVTRAIRFATDHGAKVINLSLGADLPLSLVLRLVEGLLGGDDPFQAAINYATGQGAVVVAAAGNSGLASGFVGLNNLLLVGATGPSDQVTGYSSSLLGVTLHAPGGETFGECDESHCIVTTDKEGGYKSVMGTSFAAPHVSGVAAQLISMGVSPVGVAARILTSADLPNGVRRLNAAAAVEGNAAGAVPVGPAGRSLPAVNLPGLGGLLGRLGLGPAGGGPAAPAPAAASRPDAPAVAPAPVTRANPAPVLAAPAPARPASGPDGAYSEGPQQDVPDAAPASAVGTAPEPHVPLPLAAPAVPFLLLAALVAFRVRRARAPGP